MKQIIFITIFCLISLTALAQKTELSGKIIDAATSEQLIGATVKIGITGTVSDIDGNYVIMIDKGEHEVTVSYVGYEPQTYNISLQKDKETYNFELKSNAILDEITVVADLAKERETPVAFSSISSVQIEEELGTQDMPMLLNSTPGVYATQQGGGDGDARVSIRGFNQRNIAVMIDGLPVNDMENGWVYWSNWSGLSDVTKSMQVQRGLGASKLAIPSIGGTINVITKGIESKRGITFKQSIGSGLYTKTSLSMTTGRLDNGWAVTFNGSLKYSDGYIRKVFSKGASYFIKIDKELKNHLLSFSAFGAPQIHAQKLSMQNIPFFDVEHAKESGVRAGLIDSIAIRDQSLLNNSIRENIDYGYFQSYTVNAQNDTIFDKKRLINGRTNFYHKPQFTLKDYWNISKKMKWSNIAYLSIGKGGGARLKNSVAPGIVGNDLRDPESQLYEFDNVFEANSTLFPTEDGTQSTQFVYANHNEHTWYGLLSTLSYRFDLGLNLNVGFDGRVYKGSHFGKIHDLLGGGYTKTSFNIHEEKNQVLKEGDKYRYYNEGLVRWGGAFAQLEYSADKLSAFLNVTGSYSANKQIDYYSLKKDLVLSDTTILQAVRYGDTLDYNGNRYTINSPEARFSETDWVYVPGFTFKMGANYNIDKHNNVFFNCGYYSKAPLFGNIFTGQNRLINDFENEKIRAVELGYGLKYQKFAINANIYYTNWRNRPLGGPITIADPTDPQLQQTTDIYNIDAIHTGIELDGIYKVNKKIDIEGLLSIGDWYWNSDETGRRFDIAGNDVGPFSFDAVGVHVGDAAQFQVGASVRYKPIKNVYTKLKWTRFDKYYSEFDPQFLQETENGGRESWRIPKYDLFDFTAGYRFKLNKYPCNFSVNINNVLNSLYISDANNGSSFDANTATVFMGLGRRWSASFKINL